MYNKEAKLKLETSAHYVPIGKTNIVFYDSDIGTADLVFYITRNKRPLEVSNENVDCYVILKAKDGSYIVDKMYVEDPLNGKVRFTIPKEFLSHVGNVKGQVFIAVHGKEDIVTEVEFSFNIKENIVSSIPSVDKVKYIRTFDELRERIEERVIKIEEALENGDDYVAQMDSTFQSGMKSLNDRSTQVINEIKTLSDNHKQELNILKDSNITELDDKGNQIKADIEQLNQYDTTNWQKYNMTNDDGTRKYVQGLDLLTAPPGQYESTQTVNGPLKENGEPDTGFVESDISVSSNGRRVIMATRSSYNKTYIKTLHTNGVDSGWKELTKDNTRIFLGTIGSEGNEYTSLLQLPPGYYECTIPSDAFSVDAPQDPNGNSYVAEIDVYEGSSGRKQYKLISNYHNNEYRATVHTNGDFRGWKKVQNEEEYNALFDDTGWIDWETKGNATKRNTTDDTQIKCQYRIRKVNGTRIAHLRVNVNNLTTQVAFGSIPAEYVPVEQHFVPRMPVSLHPGAMLVSKEGNLIFYQNTNDTSWLPGHYIIGEFTWVID